jgi:hypothetical protein
VPPRQHRREAEPHDLLLPDDAGGDGRPRLGEPAAQRFDLGDEGMGVVLGFGHGMAPHRAYLVSGNRPIPPTTNCKRWFDENEGHIIVTDSTAKPGPDSLIAAARAAEKQGKLPPVHLWDPPFCGDLDMEIRRDGTWFYEGTPIGRKPLVRLFSTILKREDDRFFLVTPVEKVGIRVEDAPFVAVDFEAAGAGAAQVISFTTNVGDVVVAGPENRIRVVRDDGGEPSPYVHVRAGLDALIDRKSFYRLVDLGEAHAVDGTDWFGVWSGGTFFPIIPVAELDV